MGPKSKRCCVKGCEDDVSKRHRFPKYDPELFKQWLININNPQLSNLTQDRIYKSYYVCHKHFADDCLVTGVRGLTRIAVPTLFLPERAQENKEIELVATEEIATSSPVTEEYYGTPSTSDSDGDESLTTPIIIIEKRSEEELLKKLLLVTVNSTKTNQLTHKHKKPYNSLVKRSQKTTSLHHPPKRYKKNPKYGEKEMEEDSDLGGDITVVDVYDIASDIGKECEKIIDQYGADAMTSLMPKVINALELLENLATRNERENTQLHELRSKISQLENDKLEKAEYRQKFERELEAIEEQWRAETKELVTVVTRLQEENRRLAKDVSPSHVPKSPTGQANNGDMLQKLKDSVEKQRDEIRIKDKLLQEKCSDIETLKSQVERLNSTSRELRRKHKLFQSQVRTLCDERADFLVQLQDQQRDIMGLRQRLGLAQKENEDLVKCDLPLPSNKAVYDLDDPNRPRFTTQELKDILHERNELKARVSDLEDELETYRPKNKSDTPLEEDAPVQGPLPYEPDDAPWKKCSESGIRKFFRKIFSESGSGSSFPRRSLSTLSKMALSATNEQVPV